MIRHHRLAWIVCLLLAGPLIAPAARAQGVPESIKNGAVGPEERKTIATFVEQQVAKLASVNPSDQSKARDALIQESMVRGEPAPAAYLDAYADALARAIAPSADPKAPLRQRLLAAITVAKTADIARNTRLHDVVIAQLADKATPVVLWGMKGAKAILPSVMANALLRQDGRLAKAIVDAATRTVSTPVLQEAYDAATLGLFAPTPRQPSVAETRVAVPLMQDLLALRLKQYATAIPDEPTTENLATLYLSHPSVWPNQTPEQRVRTAQEFLELLSFAVQRYPEAADPLSRVIQQVAKALYILTDDSALQNALQPLTRVDSRTDPVQIKSDADQAATALTAIAEFKAVKPATTLPKPATKAAE